MTFPFQKMNALLLIGESGAGKSTIAGAVCEKRGGSHLCERDLWRSIAHQHNFKRARDWAEAAGLSEVATAVRKLTIKLAGEHLPHGLVVIDGAYDRNLPEALRKRFPEASVGIIAVTAPDKLRLQRVQQRMGGVAVDQAKTEAAYLDNIKQKLGMADLLAQADATVTNDGALAAAVSQLDALIQPAKNALF